MAVELEFNYEEAISSMVTFSQTDIEEIRQWIQKLDKYKYVPKGLTDKQIVLFYNACDADLDKTKVCIENYYRSRKNAPEIFNHRDLNAIDLKFASGVVELFVIPSTPSQGYEIIYHRLHDTDPLKFDLESNCKLLFMVSDYCLAKRGPQSTYIILFDMKGVKLGHLTRISLSTLRKMFQYVQEAVPIRLKTIVILNAEPILDKLMLLIKPFVDEKFFDMIKIHKKNESLDELYKMIPKSNLPSDYAGFLPDMQTLHKECMKQLQLLEPYFKAEEEQRIAAIPDKMGDNALEGTFKKLDID